MPFQELSDDISSIAASSQLTPTKFMVHEIINVLYSSKTNQSHILYSGCNNEVTC